MMDHRPTSYSNNCRPTQSMVKPVAPSVEMQNPTKIPCKKELMDAINQYSFAVNESNLYLDTHPFDENAMSYFKKYRELRKKALNDYSKYYAPLIIDSAVCEKTPWSWANEPWPWEGVEC